MNLVVLYILISMPLTLAQELNSEYIPVPGMAKVRIKEGATAYFIRDEDGNVRWEINDSDIVAVHEHNPFGEPKDWSNVLEFELSGCDSDTELCDEIDPSTNSEITQSSGTGIISQALRKATIEPAQSFWDKSFKGRALAVGNFLTNNAIEDWGYGGTNVDSFVDLVELGVTAELGGQVVGNAGGFIFRKLGYIPKFVKGPWKFGSRLLHGRNPFKNPNKVMSSKVQSSVPAIYDPELAKFQIDSLRSQGKLDLAKELLRKYPVYEKIDDAMYVWKTQPGTVISNRLREGFISWAPDQPPSYENLIIHVQNRKSPFTGTSKFPEALIQSNRVQPGDIISVIELRRGDIVFDANWIFSNPYSLEHEIAVYSAGMNGGIAPNRIVKQYTYEEFIGLFGGVE